MQVVACIAFFAKRFEPVLADIVVIIAVIVVSSGGGLRRSGMAIRTPATKGAVTGKEGGADGRSGDEGMARRFEEGRE